MCCVSLNLPILYFVDYLGVTGSNTKRRAAGCNRKANKENNRFANQQRTKYWALIGTC